MPRDESLDDVARARRRRILRIGLAVALGLAIGEALEEPFSFLTPLLAFQLLMKTPRAPSVRQAVGFVLAVAIASGVALGLANSLQDRQFVYLIVLGLIYFGCFLLQLRGKGGPLPGMLLVCNAMVPVLAVISRDLAQDFVWVFILSAASAVLLAWLAHAAFPESAEATPSSAGGQAPDAPQAALRIALACTILLMPAVIHYLANDDEASVVVLITIIAVLGQRAEMRWRAALGLLLGNLIGGLLASVAYYAIVLLPSLPFLFLVTLAAAFVLAEGATRATLAAGIFTVAMPTFLILLGLGLTPITDGSDAAFVSRFIDVALASLYALAGVVLMMPRRGVMQPAIRAARNRP
jgi:uncharacterized membrane protein YgaE (UPF0421/DUF939 family)